MLQEGQEEEKMKKTQSGKYLTFQLGEEKYGLGIHKVIEIIEMQDVTPVPRTPDFVRGVINLRGIIHPVIDLNKKFGMGMTEETDITCIVIVVIERDEKSEQFGVIVDEVSAVEEIDEDDIEDTPSLGTQIDTNFIMGMAKTDDEVKMLLDIEKVLSEEELDMIGEVSKKETK